MELLTVLLLMLDLTMLTMEHTLEDMELLDGTMTTLSFWDLVITKDLSVTPQHSQDTPDNWTCMHMLDLIMLTMEHTLEDTELLDGTLTTPSFSDLDTKCHQ